MNWKIINHSAFAGKFNMEFDITLAELCGSESAYLRLYQWDPFCISLGANQNYNDINLSKAASDKIDVVKRPTGGRAILHAEEITYSVVIPVTYGLSAREVYRKISNSLIKGLTIYNPALSSLSLEESQPDFNALLKESNGSMCFGSTAKNEITYQGKKVVGSAQRKMNKSLLQHGSILCGPFHERLLNYINNVNPAAQSLTSNTTDLSNIIGDKINYSLLKSALIQGFQEEWSDEFDNYSSSVFKEDQISAYNI